MIVDKSFGTTVFLANDSFYFVLQIQDLMIEMDSSEKRSAKDALLLWCQSKTQE